MEETAFTHHHVLITFVTSSHIIMIDHFLCIFFTKVQFIEMSPQWFLDSKQGKNKNLMFFSTSTDNTLLHFSVLHRDAMGCASQSVSSKLLLDSSSSSRTGAGRSLLLFPQAEPGAVFTLLITGEGPADRRAITDSPQARGWERYKHPPLSPKCDGNVQLSQGSLHWAKPKGPKRDIKDMRGIGRVGTNRGYA